MWRNIAKYASGAGGAGVFIGGIGLQVSGFTMPILGYLLMMLGAVLITFSAVLFTIPAWPFLHKIRPRLPLYIAKGNETIQEVTPSSKLPENLVKYHQLVEGDKRNFQDRILVYSYELHASLDPQSGGALLFKFHIFNGSMFTTEIGREITGKRISLDGRELHDKPEPSTPRQFPHGRKDDVVIRQPILPEIARRIIEQATNSPDGARIEFGFEGVQIGMLTEEKLESFLPIKLAQAYRVIREQPLVGIFLRWEHIAMR